MSSFYCLLKIYTMSRNERSFDTYRLIIIFKPSKKKPLL